MTLRLLFVQSIGLAVLLSAVLGLTSQAHAACVETPLRYDMQSMKKAFKEMGGAVKAEDWETITAKRVEMQEIAAAAIKERPLLLKDTAEEKQPRLLQDYRQGMKALERKLDQLALAETSKDIGAARSIVEDIGKHSKQSHTSFKKDCD